VPALHTEIESIKDKERDLKEKKELLTDSRKRLEHQMSDQEERLEFISKKVEIWRQSLLEQNKEEERENQVILKKTKAKREIQESNVNLLKLEEAVIPKAITLAYYKMQELHGGKNGRKILKELIFAVQPNKK
jgi:hypothetical protein